MQQGQERGYLSNQLGSDIKFLEARGAPVPERPETPPFPDVIDEASRARDADYQTALAMWATEVNNFAMWHRQQVLSQAGLGTTR